MRVNKLSVLFVLFFHVFALAAPIGSAWASESDAYYTTTDVAEDEKEGMALGEIIGAVVGSVAGLAICLPIGPLGIVGGGLAGFFLGKWIGSKLSEKGPIERASDTWDRTRDRLNSDRFPGRYWWRDRWDGQKEWWGDRWDGVEDWWDSDRLGGKFWWKDRWDDVKFWEKDGENGPDAPAGSVLMSAEAAYEDAYKAYTQALKELSGAELEAIRKNFEAAAKALYEAKRKAAGN